MSKTFCILPFIHLEAMADGAVRPCCMSRVSYHRDDGRPFSLSTNTLSEVWNSKSINALRESLLAGDRNSACLRCYEEEDYGKKSKRQRENERFGLDYDGSLKFVDLKLGHTCNLKCRTCGGHSSSAWIPELTAVNGFSIDSYILEHYGTTDVRSVINWPDHNNKFWDDLHQLLPSITYFEIYGGEPFLSKRHFDLLQTSVDKQLSQWQSIHYNTNGTIYPKYAIDNIWPNFKSVSFMFSIDGIGKQFEYMRYPAKWTQIENNLKEFRLKMPDSVMVCLTLSALNVYYLPEYIDYFESIGVKVWVNMLYNPSYFCITNLPLKAKEMVMDKLGGYTSPALAEPIYPMLNYMMSTHNNLDFIGVIKKHDAYRGEDYSTTFPEIAAAMGF